ncbi:MAG: hypothetical protein JWL91_1037 [Sphingomonas bacterium]|nr:hypothetical protein [Sphingomonas bacterium]
MEHGDLIAVAKLAPFQPGELELIRTGRNPQRVDCEVEIAMLLLEQNEAPANFVGAHNV